MKRFVLVCFCLFFRVQENFAAIQPDEPCTFAVNTYQYTFNAVFHHLPSSIIDQTTLTIIADVDYYLPEAARCKNGFIRLRNLAVDPFENNPIRRNSMQLETAILQIFLTTANLLQNQSFANQIVISDAVDEKNGHQYRRIKTLQTNEGRFLDKSIFANFLLNKFLSPTRTTCETTVVVTQQKLESSVCVSTTAGLMTITRRLHFNSSTASVIQDLDVQTINSTRLTKTNQDELDSVLKRICTKNDSIAQEELIYLMNTKLNDDDLTRVLLRKNGNSYSDCEWAMIEASAIETSRSPATRFVFDHFHHDESILEHHLDIIGNQPNQNSRTILRQYLNASREISSRFFLRLVLIVAEDDLTMDYVQNRNHTLSYRAIALRVLTNSNHFKEELRTIFNDEHESIELRILCLQTIHSYFNLSEVTQLIETVKSEQIRFYARSIFNRQTIDSSMWFSHSGSYSFPFGKVNVIFDEKILSPIPNIIQLQLAENTEIDLYLIGGSKNHETKGEILVVFDRRTIVPFSSNGDLRNYLNDNHTFEMITLDGFRLKISLEINFNFKWFSGYFDQLRNFFERSIASIVLKIVHGSDLLMTGYEMRASIESNFKIHVNRRQNSTSYTWHATQKENILFKIEQTLNPLVTHRINSEQMAASTKEFCYILPHFDSKLCASVVFERKWPSSIAIRLASDDPSLVYNFTRTSDSAHFDIQQNDQIPRSYRLLRKSQHNHPLMPYYLEMSTPTFNYSSSIQWFNDSRVVFYLLRNDRLIANGSGSYHLDSSGTIGINLTHIYPTHIGEILLDYNGNFSMHAPKLLGGALGIRVDLLPSWNRGRIEIQAERSFFFFQQNFVFNLHYNIFQPSFNLTLIRNNYHRFQWAFIRDENQIEYLFIINTPLLEFDHHTQVKYDGYSNSAFHSTSLINGWSLWNMSVILWSSQPQIRVNRFQLISQVDHRSIQFEIDYDQRKLLRAEFGLNRSIESHLPIYGLIEMNNYELRSQGGLKANGTDFSIQIPIVEIILGKNPKKSHVQLDFHSSNNSLISNLTVNIRNQYHFDVRQNLTFKNRRLNLITFESSLSMIRYRLLSINSTSQFLDNSTILQYWNMSIVLPSLLVRKPFLLTYKHDQFLFIQFFDWANLTRTSSVQFDQHTTIMTPFGLRLFLIDDLSTRIQIRIEQILVGQRINVQIEIDRNWTVSLMINRHTRYELSSSWSDSLFSFRMIDMKTNQTRTLPISYHTDNETLLRIHVQFSQFFSAFINDLILNISSKNHTLKLVSHIPLFKREFFAGTWKRYLHRDLAHFHGTIETRILRRRRLIDLDYNWNLASFRMWTFDSRLALFTFNPIQFYFNLTNDYIWYGQWAMDFRLILVNRRQLIRIQHLYHYTPLLSHLLFDIHLINSYYDLVLNYETSNHTIYGYFIKNKYKHDIDGRWNTTMNMLTLNTQHMQSRTTITATLVKSFIDLNQQKIGFLFEHSNTGEFTNDSQIEMCNPYWTIQSRPRLFIVHYYTFNDGLSTMMFEWATGSYLSWNYTTNGQTFFPISKFEIDLRTKYSIRVDDLTSRFFAIYNREKCQVTLRREPIDEDADDRFEMKARFDRNRTFSVRLHVIDNRYRLIGEPCSNTSLDMCWQLRGQLRHDPFDGLLLISDDDWWWSTKLIFNSSLYIATGRHVQLISPSSHPQIAFEIRYDPHIHLGFQYAGLWSPIAVKYFHPKSDLDLFFAQNQLDQSTWSIYLHINNILNQTWILKRNDQSLTLHDNDRRLIFNGSIDNLFLRHRSRNNTNELSIDENTVKFISNDFGIFLSNLSSPTTFYLHIFHRPSQQNLTINYYKLGRFFMQGYDIETPIYDIDLTYHLIDGKHRPIKFIFEFLPLQKSSFALVRGRTFTIGYRSERKQLILTGNIAFGVEDIDDRQILLMNERWKLFYGINNNDKLFFKWNLRVDLKTKTLHGQMTVHDPKNEMTTPIFTDIRAQFMNTTVVTMHTVYSSSDHIPKPVILQVNLDQRLKHEQQMSVRFIHEYSKTNVSSIIDYNPARKLRIRFGSSELLFLSANVTESQLKLIVRLIDTIDFNLTLPKSIPETGLMNSSLFIRNDEYFDACLDMSSLKLRSKKYTFNASLDQFILQYRQTKIILASLQARWIERNSSTALITIFSASNFQRKTIPISVSAQQKTWLERLQRFVTNNQLISNISQDLRRFVDEIKNDFVSEHGQFGRQLIDQFRFDDDLTSGFEHVNRTVAKTAQSLFKLGLHCEELVQEYLNNLTCMIHHRNLLHLDLIQLVTLAGDSLAFETIHLINKTLLIFDYFTHYPRSLNAIITYLSSDLILRSYKFLNQFVLESKLFTLSKAIHYSQEFDQLLNTSVVLSNSIPILASDRTRNVIHMFNDRLRRLLSIWLQSPIEHKLLRTITVQLMSLIDRIRFRLDNRLDFLLPNLLAYTSRLSTNSSMNQTFLLTWSKQLNLSHIVDNHSEQ